MPAIAVVFCMLSLTQTSATPEQAAVEPTPESWSPTAMEVLRRADEAARAVHAVRYEARRFGTGEAARRFLQVEGTVMIAGAFERHFDTARFEALLKFPGSDLVHRATYAADGDSYCLIDHDEKIYYHNSDPRVTGHMGRFVQFMGMREFIHPTPFQDELNGVSAELVGRESVCGEPCYVVDVLYAGQKQRAIWYFSIKDFLPRRVERILNPSEREKGGPVIEIAGLEVDPAVDAETFRIDVPEDYRQSPRFAVDLMSMPL